MINKTNKPVEFKVLYNILEAHIDLYASELREPEESRDRKYAIRMCQALLSTSLGISRDTTLNLIHMATKAREITEHDTGAQSRYEDFLDAVSASVVL